MQSDHLHDTDKDDDLAEVMFGSPVTEDFSVSFAGNRDESTTPEPTQEYPIHDDDLDLARCFRDGNVRITCSM